MDYVWAHGSASAEDCTAKGGTVAMDTASQGRRHHDLRKLRESCAS